jgi:hypothetical protein
MIPLRSSLGMQLPGGIDLDQVGRLMSVKAGIVERME